MELRVHTEWMTLDNCGLWTETRMVRFSNYANRLVAKYLFVSGFLTSTCQHTQVESHSINESFPQKMPRKRWTTTDQLDWLQPWIPAFTKAQESKEFNSFFVEMYDAWFKKYSLDQLKAQEIGKKIKGLEEAEAAGNTEKVEKIREAWWQLVSAIIVI